jgi:hypothetical protein
MNRADVAKAGSDTPRGGAGGAKSAGTRLSTASSKRLPPALATIRTIEACIMEPMFTPCGSRIWNSSHLSPRSTRQRGDDHAHLVGL